MNKYTTDSFWLTLATNLDEDGFESVSMMEAKNFPLWGVIFHPEKIPFEKSNKYNIPHDFDSVRAANHFAHFFVDQARRLNEHKFANGLVEEEEHLIYNWY